MLLPTLLLTILCSLVYSDPVYIEVKIHCNIPNKKWCATLQLHEEDTTILGHDLLAREYFCSSENWERFNYTVYPSGDAPTSEYEFIYSLIHDCSTDGKLYCTKSSQSTDVSVSGVQHVKFGIEADEIRRPGECI